MTQQAFVQSGGATREAGLGASQTTPQIPPEWRTRVRRPSAPRYGATTEPVQTSASVKRSCRMPLLTSAGCHQLLVPAAEGRAADIPESLDEPSPALGEVMRTNLDHPAAPRSTCPAPHRRQTDAPRT